MAYHLPVRVDGPADQLGRARELDELRHDRRPLVVLVAVVVGLLLVAGASALLGAPAAPVDARSTSSPTAERVPAVEVVDMRPARAVPLPPVTTPVRR